MRMSAEKGRAKGVEEFLIMHRGISPGTMELHTAQL